jgi:hypothetical protein
MIERHNGDQSGLEAVTRELPPYQCGFCGGDSPIQRESRSVTCTHCGEKVFFCLCPGCGTGQALKGAFNMECQCCSIRMQGAEYRVSFGILIDRASSDTSSGESSSSRYLTQQRTGFLYPLNILDGAGWAPSIGSTVALSLYRDYFILGRAKVLLGAVTDVQVEGQSITTGGGFIGGGFGLTGAIEGMAVASVLNALTKKTHSWVAIAVMSTSGWVSMNYVGTDLISVRRLLRPLADAIFVAQEDRTPQLPTASERVDSTDLVSQLERLAALRVDGVLTEEEFQLAKTQLLNRESL